MSANDTPIIPSGGSSTPEGHHLLGKHSREVEDDVESAGREVAPYRNFECTDCHASFAKSPGLKAHMTSCHPEKANWRGINNPQSPLRLPAMASVIGPSVGVGNGDQVVASEDVWDTKEKFGFTKKVDQGGSEKVNKNEMVDHVLEDEAPPPPVDPVLEVEAPPPPVGRGVDVDLNFPPPENRRGVDVDLNFPPPEDY